MEDPWTQEILKYTEMGFSREEVCMAMAALGSAADRDDQVRQHAQSITPAPCDAWA